MALEIMSLSGLCVVEKKRSSKRNFFQQKMCWESNGNSEHWEHVAILVYFYKENTGVEDG